MMLERRAGANDLKTADPEEKTGEIKTLGNTLKAPQIEDSFVLKTKHVPWSRNRRLWPKAPPSS
jgi:hypothetical protein